VLFCWTTSLADVPGLLARLSRRSVRLAAVGTAVALALRLAPVLLQELHTVLLVSRRRHRGTGRRARRFGGQVLSLLPLTCASAVRRAAELGEAAQARGGLSL
jgi:energy-coupling factor transporter transmembrane protein EcfT